MAIGTGPPDVTHVTQLALGMALPPELVARVVANGVAKDVTLPGAAAAEDTPDRLKADLERHIAALGLPGKGGNGNCGQLTKESIRKMHAAQRGEVFEREYKALSRKWTLLMQQFAAGASEIDPGKIEPELVPVVSDTETADLFRMAALQWSVPVSRGFGRRMRYLVRDRQNGKVMGIFALTDPVFNLHVRDKWIGWDVRAREQRLVHVMDAYVVGAVAPYNQLRCGKLVASLIGSREVGEEFERRYSATEGIISKKQKHARLALVTVTSALGRSSLYNRLKLWGPRYKAGNRRLLVGLERVGETVGYGHFQLSEELFGRIRQVLAAQGHSYAHGHQYGDGPNWRMRVVREGLKLLGLDQELLKHGIGREVFVMLLAENCQEFLRGEVEEVKLERPSVAEIGKAAVERWVQPHAL